MVSLHRKSMKDSLWSWIIKAKIREKPPRTVYDYRYSDMGFYILTTLAEKMLNQPMEDFLDQNLYEPLGAYTLGYLPLQKFPINQIAPTEDDKLFRKKLLTGYVHDQGAAMHGNIAGHAGLLEMRMIWPNSAKCYCKKEAMADSNFISPKQLNFLLVNNMKPAGAGWVGINRPSATGRANNFMHRQSNFWPYRFYGNLHLGRSCV
jgi:hypothetical protein